MMTKHDEPYRIETPGVSGMSLYVPKPRVSLEDWCQWYGAPWDKVRSVVGEEFRVCGPRENTYTMAAAAVLRLIDAYEIDPRRVRTLALGTESSTDNAAGAIIVRGLLDRALAQRGLPPIPRACEVPEFKHACLGGMYGLKAALRAMAAAPHDDAVAIVVASDVAEYARGSTGEQTQGAGAVAMLVERTPRLFSVDLATTGSASAYRGVDFRKPFARHFVDGYRNGRTDWRDFPVFNGRFSTLCYLDEVARAFDDMMVRRSRFGTKGSVLSDVASIFFHRPFHHMPVQALAFLVVASMARNEAQRELFDELCRAAEVDPGDARTQVDPGPDALGNIGVTGDDGNPLAHLQRVAKVLSRTKDFESFVSERMSLGISGMRRLGNLYTAALPAWLASGFHEAARDGRELAGDELLAIGYGSGDAAESWMLRVCDGWQDAASKIQFDAALADPAPLDRDAYEELHDERSCRLPPAEPFAIETTGTRIDGAWQDVGVDYYRVRAG